MTAWAVLSVRSPRIGRSRCLSRRDRLRQGCSHTVRRDARPPGLGRRPRPGRPLRHRSPPRRHYLQRLQGAGEEPACRDRIPPGGQQYVDDLPVLVDRPVHVPPDAVDLDVGLINEPAVTRREPGEPSCVGPQRSKPLHPPVDGDMVHVVTTLGEQLLDVAVLQVVTQVPEHRHQDRLRRQSESRERR